MNPPAAAIWYGNTGTPPPPPEVLVEVVEAILDALEDVEGGVVDAKDELAAEVVEDDAVEVVVVVDVSAASGTTATVELPLMATNVSPFAGS